jgi:hypothetical protein
MKTIIKVTSAHIDSGQICDSSNCPIALATNAVLPDGYYAHVEPHSIVILRKNGTKPPGFKTYPLPKKVTTFIVEYDATTANRKKDDAPGEFQFTLDIILPTDLDTGDSYCTEVEHPFDLDSLVEPSKAELEKIKHDLFG